MKSEDLRKVIFRKYEDGDDVRKIFRDLHGSMGLNTVKRWCKVICDTDSIQLLISPGVSRLARTCKTIDKVERQRD